MNLHSFDSASLRFLGAHTRQIPADPARIVLGTLARSEPHRHRRGPGHDQLGFGAASRALRSFDYGEQPSQQQPVTIGAGLTARPLVHNWTGNIRLTALS